MACGCRDVLDASCRQRQELLLHALRRRFQSDCHWLGKRGIHTETRVVRNDNDGARTKRAKFSCLCRACSEIEHFRILRRIGCKAGEECPRARNAFVLVGRGRRQERKPRLYLVRVRGRYKHQACRLVWIEAGEHLCMQPSDGMSSQKKGAREMRGQQGKVQVTGGILACSRPGRCLFTPAQSGTIVKTDGGHLGYRARYSEPGRVFGGCRSHASIDDDNRRTVALTQDVDGASAHVDIPVDGRSCSRRARADSAGEDGGKKHEYEGAHVDLLPLEGGPVLSRWKFLPTVPNGMLAGLPWPSATTAA